MAPVSDDVVRGDVVRGDVVLEDVKQDVRSAAHAYEAALIDGDVEAATGWFDLAADDVSRFGPTGESVGEAEIRTARAAQAPVAAPAWLLDEVRVLSPDSAVHLAVLDRGGTIVQRTQVWVRTDAGAWRIAHAHVSNRPGSNRPTKGEPS